MRLVRRWVGLEIAFVQVGHGLLGAGAIGLIASQAPWWFTIAIAPLIVFSLAFWLFESSLILPVARRLITDEAMTAAGDDTATTRPRG